MTTMFFTTRNFICALLAIACTYAVHGGWLAAMDRDAIAATTPAVA